MAEDEKPEPKRQAGPSTLYHPTLPGVTREVAASQVEAWTAQGWRKTKPKK